MRLEYANYPALEEAFARFVQEARRGAEEKILVVCPSGRVGSHLKRKLAEKFPAVGNIYFSSFGGLLRELDAQSGGVQKKLLPNDDLHDFIIREIISHPGLNRYAAGRGFVGALKSSLRDLADSLADPDVLREHALTGEDPRLQADAAHLKWLADVYEAYLDLTSRVPGYRSYAQFFDSALKQTENSGYLHSFAHIVFYGFYDMTGRQLELFSRIAFQYPVTVFAPYEPNPLFTFAHKFFESNYKGKAESAQEIPPLPNALGKTGAALFVPGQSAPCSPLFLASAAGTSGELFFTAKQILKLVEEEGYSFEDIAVIARNTQNYQDELCSVFEQNCIPFNASVQESLADTPLGIFCLNLLALAQEGFARETVLAVVSSAYFVESGRWSKLVKSSLASRDYAQWVDLVNEQAPYYDPSFLTWLEVCKNRLEGLDQSLMWEDLCERVLCFLQDNLRLDALTEKEQEIWAEVVNCIEGFKRRCVLRAASKEKEFIPDLLAALSALRMKRGIGRGGVTFMDVLNARGLGFRAVFLLGMNEKVFPHHQPEDPILKDYYRAQLRDGLGYWLNQVRERLEEEKLLFYLLISSARERLYITWQQADEEGKPALVSLYVTELARAAQLDLKGPRVSQVDGRLLPRLESISPKYFTPKEMSAWIMLRGGIHKADYFKEAALMNEELERGLPFCEALGKGGEFGPADGKIQSGKAIFERIDKKGFSASSLAVLAQCPMKYFLSRGLRLQEPEEPLLRDELAPNLQGNIYHEILKLFYMDLVKKGQLKDLFSQGVSARLQEALDVLYPSDAYKRFGIYPVIWELILADIKEDLLGFVLKDMEKMGDFVPSLFEYSLEGEYEPAPGKKLHIYGTLDRVDLDLVHKQYRVADYKSSKKAGRVLAADILKKNLFQPFLYLVLAGGDARLKGYVSAGSCLISIRGGYQRKELSAAEFEVLKPKADAFFARLIQLVEAGDFYVQPSKTGCPYCSFNAVCRRYAFRSLLRAGRCRAAKELEERRNA